MSRGPTDQEVMRQLASIRTRLQFAIPRAEITVVGVANVHNQLSAWMLKAEKDGRVAEHAMPPDQPVDVAAGLLKARLEKAGDA